MLPLHMPGQTEQCFLQESCHPYLKTLSGGPKAVAPGHTFESSGVDTAYVLMNLFPLSDDRIAVNVTFDFDKSCWRQDRYCALYIK
jgi:hypothetical protein